VSRENIQIDREAAEAFNRRDVDAWLAHFDREIVWWAIADEPEPGPFQGHQAVLDMADRWLELLPDIRIEIKEHIDAGEYVITTARMCGHAAGSVADVVVDEVFVDKYRDGKIVEVREYRTRQEALEAVGLSEQDAHADP
jgi:ketosteroid isomerase-like protein